MKNLLFIFVCLPCFVQAQSDCRGYVGDEVFQANRIGALFSPQGGKFASLNHDGYFKAPYTSENSPSTIYASAPWIGGYKDGELKLAGTSFAFIKQDYYTGPLNPEATTYPDLCNYFDHIWSVSRGEIEQHILDAADGNIEDTIHGIFGWPAQGNMFFGHFNPFELPTDHNGGWAEFDDLNDNGIYEPQSGEYPFILLKGVPYIPEQIFWMVFNDQGPHEQTNGNPLGVEIQLTVFGFNCNNNTVLNNTLFNTYKIINQDGIELDSVYFGMWTDYDLGCSADDYIGSDSVRHTEFVYNDEVDGDSGGDCSTGAKTYGDLPPVQSMTYLSHPMHSFLADGLHPANHDITPEFPQESYVLLSGKWIDGTPITPEGDGYNPGYPGGSTHFLYNGDPRDSLQWSWYQESIDFGDPRAVSSVYLNTLQPQESVIVETAYMFHQDSSLDHLDQVGFMYSNIDSLFKMIADTTLYCLRSPACTERDCVWPGDFNHNGIADHFDILYWGVVKDSFGPQRDGRINWDGHSADPWALTIPGDLNAKHGDGNGNGIVNDEDIDRNIRHYLLTNPYYEPQAFFPEGPEIVLTSGQMWMDGRIPNIRIQAGVNIPNVLGLAYEIDFDTMLYEIQGFRAPICPEVDSILCLHSNDYDPIDTYFEISPRYGFVKTDHLPLEIEARFNFDRLVSGLALKEGVTFADIPDTVIIRLKNLIAIDAEGNDLHIGSGPLVVYKQGIVGIQDPVSVPTEVYPNPATGTIQIETTAETDAQVFSIQGQLIRHLTSAEVQLPVDVSALAPGIYIFRISATGESIKVVVQ